MLLLPGYQTTTRYIRLEQPLIAAAAVKAVSS